LSKTDLLERLKTALAGGAVTLFSLRSPDFDSIRSRPRFQRLLEQYED